MDTKEILKKLGLEEKEIEIYLALLNIGETTIMPLVENLRLPRTTIYHTLERLRNYKLIDIVLRNKRRLYIPLPPGRIKYVLQREKLQAEEKLLSYENALPELNKIYKSSSIQPQVRLFRNKEICLIYDEILDLADELWLVGEMGTIDVLGERYLKSWIKSRIKKKIPSRAISVRPDAGLDKIYCGTEGYLRTVRQAPDWFQSPTHILIYGNNVAIITTGNENFGLVITSKEYAKSMRNWFEAIWQISKVT